MDRITQNVTSVAHYKELHFTVKLLEICDYCRFSAIGIRNFMVFFLISKVSKIQCISPVPGECDVLGPLPHGHVEGRREGGHLGVRAGHVVLFGANPKNVQVVLNKKCTLMTRFFFMQFLTEKALR
jgi:hypothetical protein